MKYLYHLSWNITFLSLDDEYISLRTHKYFSSVHYREPRGFGFVQYYDPDAAADAKYYMDGQVVLGRQITVVFAEENRKKPQGMRTRDRVRFVGSSQCDYLATGTLPLYSFLCFCCILQGSFL